MFYLTSSGIYQTVPVYAGSTEVNRSFYEGRHYIEYKATDEAGNFDHCSFTVTVRGETSYILAWASIGNFDRGANVFRGSKC